MITATMSDPHNRCAFQNMYLDGVPAFCFLYFVMFCNDLRILAWQSTQKACLISCMGASTRRLLVVQFNVHLTIPFSFPLFSAVLCLLHSLFSRCFYIHEAPFRNRAQLPLPYSSWADLPARSHSPLLLLLKKYMNFYLPFTLLYFTFNNSVITHDPI